MHRQITSMNFNASEVAIMHEEGGDDIDGIPFTVVFDYGQMLNRTIAGESREEVKEPRINS